MRFFLYKFKMIGGFMNHNKMAIFTILLCVLSIFAIFQIYKFSNEKKLETNLTEVYDNQESISSTKGYKEISFDNFLYLKDNTSIYAYGDVPSWANEQAHYFKALGLFENDDYFNPNNNVTYNEFSQILKNLLGLETTNLAEYNLLSLDEKGDLGYLQIYENSYILREQVAFILCNIIKFHAPNISPKYEFTIEFDEEIAEYAEENFILAIQLEMLRGDGSRNFRPSEQITKAELSSMLYNMTNLFTN